ncbi:MAG: hypothetical protein R6U11_01745 [Bacteroidales bacterium]
MPEDKKEDREPFFENNFDFLNKILEPVSQKIWKFTKKEKTDDFREHNKDLVTGNYKEWEIEFLHTLDTIVNLSGHCPELNKYKVSKFREIMMTANASKGRGMSFLKEINSRTVTRREETPTKKQGVA